MSSGLGGSNITSELTELIQVANAGGSSFVVNTDSKPALFVDNNAKVGINTLTPSSQFEVSSETGECVTLRYGDSVSAVAKLNVQADGDLEVVLQGAGAKVETNSSVNIAGHNASTAGLMLAGEVVQASATQLGYVATTEGSATPSKAVVLDSNRSVTGINSISATSISGTLQTGSQPNITDVGTLTSLNVSGNVSATNVAGTLTTSAQPNITQVGTLTSLNVSGAVSAATLSGTLQSGPQPNITSIGGLTSISVAGSAIGAEASFLSGAVAGAAANSKVMVLSNTGAISGISSLSATSLSGTLQTGAQPNITQVGTLSSLSVTNAVTAGTLAGTLTTGAQPNITSIGSLTSLTVGGVAITNELGLLTSITAGTASPSKAVVLNVNRGISGLGTVSATSLAGTLTTGAQPNITSVGALTSVSIAGSTIGAEAAFLSGAVAGSAANSKAMVLNSSGSITGINALSATSLTGTLQTAAQPNISSVGTLTSLGVSGSVSLTSTSDASGVSAGGALTVSGGAAVAKKLYVGSDLHVSGTIFMNGSVVGTGGSGGGDGGSSSPFLDGVTAGTATASKALVLDSSSSISGINSLSTSALTLTPSSFTYGESWNGLGNSSFSTQALVLSCFSPTLNMALLFRASGTVGTDAAVIYSNPLITTSFTLPMSGVVRGALWHPVLNKFIITIASGTTSSTSRIYSSVDGFNWTLDATIIAANVGTSNLAYHAASGRIVFFAGNRFYHSVDGLIFNDMPLSSSLNTTSSIVNESTLIVGNLVCYNFSGIAVGNFKMIWNPTTSEYTQDTTSLLGVFNGRKIYHEQEDRLYIMTTLQSSSYTMNVVDNASTKTFTEWNSTVRTITIPSSLQYSTSPVISYVPNYGVITVFTVGTSPNHDLYISTVNNEIQTRLVTILSSEVGPINASTITSLIHFSTNNWIVYPLRSSFAPYLVSIPSGTSNTITFGSTTFTENELAVLDGVTAGTATASKALVLDSSSSISGINSLSATSLSGTLATVSQPSITSVGTLTSLNVSGATTLSSTTDATSATAGGALTIGGGVAVAKKAYVGEDLYVSGTIYMNGSPIGSGGSGSSSPFLDGVTAGRATASKALVLDSNKSITGITSLTSKQLLVDSVIEYGGINWASRTSAVNNSWQSVCWSPELNLFVAVANSGIGNRVMTSPNGINWTSRTSAVNNSWNSVCWSPELNLFVVVASSGTGNRVMTSPDGINWTSRTSAADNGWVSVCWGSDVGLFVAVANSGTENRVMTSPDGINWTSRMAAVNNSWSSVCWSPELNLFVAVAISGAGNRVMTSPDGINWTSRTSAVDNAWISVCWGSDAGLFVAVSYSGTGNRVMTSPDGINWTSRTSAVDNNWSSVCWGSEAGLFVVIAVNGAGNRVMTSPDGINWTTRTSAVDNSWISVCWSPELSLFAVVSYDGAGNRVMTSSHITSTTVITGANGGLSVSGATTLSSTTDATSATAGGALTIGGGIAVAKKAYVGEDLYVTGTIYMNGSPIGSGGGGSSSPFLDGVTAGTAAASKALVLDSSLDISGINSLSATSLSGTLATASQPNITSLGTLTSLSVSGDITGTLATASQPNITSLGTLNSLSVSGTVGLSSTTDATSATAGGALTIGGGIAVAKKAYVGEDLYVSGSIYMNGTPISTSGGGGGSSSPFLDGVVAGRATASKALVLDSTKSITGITSLTSEQLLVDSVSQYGGDVWSLRTSAVDNSWRSVCWSPELDLFVAVAATGTGNRVMTSSDGITWTARTSATDNGWTSVCWSPELGLFVAVAGSGNVNRVMTSPNGITWTARTSATDNSWQSVCWSPELDLFVAVAGSGTGNRVMTSSDGITWTSRTSATDNNWNSICWSPELSLFVAVSISGTENRVMTSSDGINWTTRSSPVDNNWASICWSSELGLFVAVSISGTGNRVMTSSDGITWTTRSSAADNDWASICWSSELGLFVAVSISGTGNRVMVSSNGITWTTRSSPVDNNWRSVCWSPELSLFAAVATSGTGNRVMTSSHINSTTVITGANGGLNVAGNIRSSGLLLTPTTTNATAGQSIVNGLWVSTQDRHYGMRQPNSENLVMLCYSAGGTYNDYITWNHNSGSPTYTISASTVSVSGVITSTATTASSSTTTGALTVAGGVGIGGAVNVAGNLRITSTTASNSTSTGALVVSGGVGIGGNVFCSGTRLDCNGFIGTGSYVVSARNTVAPTFIGNWTHNSNRWGLGLSTGNTLSLAETTTAGAWVSPTTWVNLRLAQLFANDNVGIGTTSPSVPLHVTNTTSHSFVGQYGFLNSNGAGNSGNGWTGSGFSAIFSGMAQASEFRAISDKRLKSDIQSLTLEHCKSFIDSVNPVSFKFKNSPSKSFGYIAQEVAKTDFENLVSLVLNDEMKEEIDEDEFVSPEGAQLTMNYDGVVPILHKCIKDLYSENEAMKQELAEMKATIQQLMNMMNQ